MKEEDPVWLEHRVSKGLNSEAGYGDWVVLAKAFAIFKEFILYLVSNGEII